MTTNQNRQPTHRLYTVKGDNDQARWLEIGAAWPNKDNQGFTLQFDALPTDGRVVMREIAERENGGQS
ncbi:hypothetical protein [Sphingobium sp. CCH11-B1]|jgi:hypothetical protein|uniref:hypothetical protein n=1 Tax=Sphingobium sp. CCH11-B1 TaxID=1768781 RepID=UPI000831B8EF|nr:hypothetical protein [Sphingobium sp. CCH11-B1]